MAQAATTKTDLQDTIDQVGDLIDEALDPALTGEDVIEKLQSIDALLSGESDDVDSDDTDDSEDDDDLD